MNIFELFLLAVGLSMDAFAVAVSIGLTVVKSGFKKPLIVGLYFGFFQGAMPLLGYMIARNFADHITAYSHWVAFTLLVFLGVKMIISGLKKDKDSETTESSLSPKQMLPLAIATSIDALAVGVSLAFLYVSIIPAVTFIGVVTFVISTVGVYVGKVVGAKFKAHAALLGGVILVLMGVRILVEHL